MNSAAVRRRIDDRPSWWRGDAFVAATVAALSHLIVALAVESESFVLFCWPEPHGFGPLAGFFAKLPFLQLQFIAVAAVLGACVALAWRWRAGRVLAIALAVLVNAYLVLDQIGFGLFGDHLSPSMSEQWPPPLGLLVDSALAEAGWATLANAGLVVLCGIALAAPALRARFRLGLARVQGALARRRWLPWLAAFAAAASIAASAVTSNEGLETHPLFALLRPASTQDLAVAAATEDLFRAREPARAEPDETMAAIAAARATLTGTRPNVLLLVLESVGATQLMSKGQLRADRAPHIAQLAQQALVFDQIYTVSPFTLPSHLYMHTGGQALTVDRDRTPLAPYAGPTLAKEMRAAGYRTAFMTGGDLAYAGTLSHIEAAGYEEIFHAASLSADERREHALNSWGVDDAVVFTHADEWVKRQAADGAPFFLQILTLATHHPFTVPESVAPPPGPSVQRYEAALRYTDQLFADFLASLEAQQLLQNTVIAITGDHGQPFSEVHLNRSGHGRALYDDAIRTFLILAAPGRLTPGTQSHRLGIMGDLMPTLTALAGRRPRTLAQDLLSPDREPRIAYFFSLRPPLRPGLRDGRWKFLGGTPFAKPELYDLDADPTERTNIAAKMPDKVAAYQTLASEWYASATQRYKVQAGSAPSSE